MRVRRIESRRDFEALAPVWAEVARESGQSSPFLSHDWFGCCWGAAAELSRRPEVLFVEDSAGPVALVPLARSVRRLHGLRIRSVGMLTVPDSPFVDWVMVGRPEAIVDAVIGELERVRDWEVLSLNALPVESQTVKALRTGLEGRLRWRQGPSVRSPYVTVTGTWDSYWAAKSQRFKKTIRSVRNRLARAGSVSVEEYRRVSPDSSTFAEMVEVSRSSWKAARGLAIATMPGVLGFFRALTERASTQGWLRLWLLRLEGRAVATEYQLEAEGRVHALRADFDAGVPEDLSPGTYLSDEILQALFKRDGVHEYDMGPGENPYKVRWASATHETVELRVFGPGLYGGILQAFETRVVPALRQLLRREPSR